MARVRIGIVSDLREVTVGAWQGLSALLVPATYPQAVAAAGGRPVVIPPLALERDEIAATLDDLDGLLLIGGRDLDPELYGAAPDPHTDPVDEHSRLRDGFERDLLEAAIARDLPTLGICRGVQMLNVVLGGDLTQHLDGLAAEGGHLEIPGSFAEHGVQALPDTNLATMVGERPVRVASHHHQGIDQVAATLTVSARSPDGLVEALELNQAQFCLGVLWHPEEHVPGSGLSLFEGLVRAAQAGRASAS